MISHIHTANNTIANVPCGDMANAGRTYFSSPHQSGDNIPSFGVVGSVFNITWRYDNINSAFPQKEVVLRYAYEIQSGSPAGWKEIVRVPRGTLSYNWTIPNLADGNYRLRASNDDVDDFFSRVDFAQSVAFKIINPKDVNPAPDKFGPHSFANCLRGKWNVIVLLLLGVLLY
jgi:hypothetical protein